MRLFESMKDNQIVDAVDEFRPKMSLHRRVYVSLDLGLLSGFIENRLGSRLLVMIMTLFRKSLFVPDHPSDDHRREVVRAH